MITRRSRVRISESISFGPFRFRLSAPLGRGRLWGSVGMRTGRRGWTSVSFPVGSRRKRR
jgi:hypothetical protein